MQELDNQALKDRVEHGLQKHASGLLIFAGFSSTCIIEDAYLPPRQHTFGVDSRVWQDAVDFGVEIDDPVIYAYEASIGAKRGQPAIGAFDTSLLRQTNEAAGQLYLARQDLELADACVRIVVWDK